MHYSAIKKNDIANGTGVRTTLFVSGCTHACKGCFNADTWDFFYGDAFTQAIEHKIYDACRPAHISGLTLLGGEPMEPENQLVLLPFVQKFKAIYPQKTIWCYSGYTFEQLTGKEQSRGHCALTDEFLQYIDVLVDGEFKQELFDIRLKFKGSSNQRVIDMQKTLKEGEIVLLESCNKN